MLIDKDSVVTLSYQLFSLDDQKQTLLLEERSLDDPLDFIFGRGVLLPKVEESIKGKGFGFKTSLDLHPRDAFGLHREELTMWVPLDNFPKELELGMKFQTQGPDGQVMAVIVKEIQGDRVLIDGNHPLAGLNLQFDLKILRVRKATDKELMTGEVDPTRVQ